MKTFKYLVVAALISLSTVTYANDGDKFDDKPETLTEFVTSELGTDFSDYISTEQEYVHIEFTVNKKKEFVVMSTNAKTTSFDHFIKSKLNYKIVERKDLEEGRVYTIKVNFQNG